MVEKAVVVALLIVVGTGSFYFGNSVGKEAHASDYSKGYEKAKADNPPVDLSRFVFASEYESLREDHNKLVDDYNALVKYANTPQYQPRQSITCNSYDYGLNSTSTTCY